MQKREHGLPTVDCRGSRFLDPHHASSASGKARNLLSGGTPIHILYLDQNRLMAL
jgi:hypothetical protein